LWVTPRTIYRWIERFEGRDDWPLAERLADASRSGRPNTVAQRLDPLLEQLIDDSPENQGYAATVWTAPLLCQHLKKVHHLDASQRSVSRALERLELKWKRPRYCLARQSPTWRQAKGGSSAGLANARVR
jgi:transposase